ncbi:MAG TPA: PepSY domain-containing protein [Azospirillum sp.]|nr:PepSY domain-containing protein [Azospirillum sp.]
MKRTLSVAAFAAVMAVAPIAMAQMNTRTDGGDPRGIPRMSTGSGLPSESPQVESMERGTTDIDRLSPGTRSGASGGGMGTMGSGAGTSGATTTPQTGRVVTSPGMGSGMGGGGVMMQVDRSDLAERRGRGQNNMELMQTSLLNSFSAAGFRAVRDFRKDGDRYVANAMDQNGNWVTVQMDPSTGAISSAR